MEHQDIENLFKNHEERIKKIEEMLSVKKELIPTIHPEKISLSEFTVKKNPKSDVQRTVIFAYFLEKHDKLEFFNSDDILNCFLKSKSSKPDNISDKINKCIRKGWISEHPQKRDNKKAYYLTKAGETTVENNFQTE